MKYQQYENQDLVFTGATPDEVWPLVRDFHYSKRMPCNTLHCYVARVFGGLFGDTGNPVAAAIFSSPPTRWGEDVLELSRLVKRPDVEFLLSRLIGFSFERLRKNKRHLIVSFADWTQRHHGGVYQASGWNYGGFNDRRIDGLIIDGRFKPGRSCNSTWGTRSPSRLQKILKNRKIEPHYDDGKFFYWKALSVAGRTKAKKLGLKTTPYPKPSATRLSDAPLPSGESHEHTVGVAP